MTSHVSPFSVTVHATVRRIPTGKVLTYGDVAALAGRPGAARGVGSVLRELPEGSDVPWWRVVSSSGDIALPHFGGQLQKMLLRQEGVTFRSGGRIDLERFRWQSAGPENQ
jgi:methylated-DNA-protein-cysteine methyltransferase-like protein